jgi:hypothetical protein
MISSTIPEDKISTKTMIITTNLNINIPLLFDKVPVINLDTPLFKNKEKVKKFICSQQLNDGDIIYIDYQGISKGVSLKKKNKKYFRNSLTMIMFCSGKLINFKIPKKGRIQVTGVKKDIQVEKCIKIIWEYLQNIPDSYEFTDGSNEFFINLRTVMTNVDFNLGFGINRQLLDIYINKYTPFNSLLETSFGYTGLNVKIGVTLDLDEKIPTLRRLENGEWVHGTITQGDYINSLNPKDKKKELTKKRCNTFLIFYSGRSILSGINFLYMKDVFSEFTTIIRNAREFIEE